MNVMPQAWRKSPRPVICLTIGVLAALAGTLAAAPTASATPPTILSISQTAGHIHVSWQLPSDGSTPFRVQIASAANVGGDGEFFSENVVADDLLSTGTTSWTDTDPLPAGTYYVHVADSNLTCSSDNDCFSEEWSATTSVRVSLSVGFAWGTTRTGHVTSNRAIAGGTLIVSAWNADGALPPGTKGVCTQSNNLLLHKTADKNINGQWTCTYRLPKTLIGKRITVTLNIVFGTTGAFLHKTVTTTVTRR
jgi:hypothetical protein